LIAHGWPEDVWFHVDNLSSAHIYLRMRDNETWDAIPEELLTDCAQLTKANSIEGNKKDNITIIYTPWSNLKKDGSMATGQVGFKDNKKVRRVYVSARENAIVNRLNKTKVEKHPDLRQEKEDRERELRKVERIAQQERVGRDFSEEAYGYSNGMNVERGTDDDCRRRKRPSWLKNDRGSNGKRTICTTTCSPRTRCKCLATRTEMRTSWMTLCEGLLLGCVSE
jgi:hypothetical protein